MPGMSFDRVAEIYDDTRGGERRGNSYAADLAPWIAGHRVLEIGVGTGVIASGLERHGYDVVGIDLSRGMLERARARIGNRVMQADADHLPIGERSVDTVMFVWVLHLVEDAVSALTEAWRVLRPGGRVIAITNNGEFGEDDEFASTDHDLYRRIRPLQHAIDAVALAPDNLTLLHDGHTSWHEFETTVRSHIDGIEQRQYSSLWDLDDATWTEFVAPVLERLRALPDRDRPRQRRSRHPLVVWSVEPTTGQRHGSIRFSNQ